MNFLFAISFGEETLVRQHDTSNEDVHEDAKFDPPHRLDWNFFIELRCLAVVLQ